VVIPEGASMPHAIPGALTLGLDILRNEHELGTRMFFFRFFLGKRDGAGNGYVSVSAVAILGLQGGLQLSMHYRVSAISRSVPPSREQAIPALTRQHLSLFAAFHHVFLDAGTGMSAAAFVAVWEALGVAGATGKLIQNYSEMWSAPGCIPPRSSHIGSLAPDQDGEHRSPVSFST
jgi:hypothetical protein